MACILNKNTIVDISNQLRINKDKVVFTHGSFDLYHVGHALFLKESKKRGLLVDSDFKASSGNSEIIHKIKSYLGDVDIHDK